MTKQLLERKIKVIVSAGLWTAIVWHLRCDTVCVPQCVCHNVCATVCRGVARGTSDGYKC